MDEKSGMTGDCHVPFCGSPGVRFPRATRPWRRTLNPRKSNPADRCTILVLSSLKTKPRGASHSARRALICSACRREWQSATKSSAYAEVRVMPTMGLDLLVKAVSRSLVSA